MPTNAQVVLHIIRVAERHYTPFPLPPAPPTAQDMKEAVQSGGFDEDEMGAAGYSAGDTNQHSVEAGPLANQTLDEDEAEGDGNSTQGKKASGHGKIVGAFRKVAKKAAVFRGDVHVEGEPTTKQKVGNKIDRLLHHSRAKDEMTPYCESTHICCVTSYARMCSDLTRRRSLPGQVRRHFRSPHRKALACAGAIDHLLHSSQGFVPAPDL